MNPKWVLATQNKGKILEFQRLFQEHGVDIVSFELGQEVAETGQTFQENALLKAQAFAHASGHIALADDSGLEVEALGGQPGVFSARWAGPDQNYVEVFKILEERLADVNKPRATFVCALCLYADGHAPQYFEGRLEGHLQFPPTGIQGFGYDPIFVPNGYDVTLAQMSPEDKNQISHRSQALCQLIDHLSR
ncbi:MAG: RdgB/HAM1 family non-canonical purine NTP pyrophosphatase [Alphaproteobacteria bacterium]|nr:RdgB/HAM1 family non-canonical purine NTP pyrophosphatase [Alphaproteobacteria bacterium]OJV46456.1 MAG: non-canonical purine NTP pyrophosphatase, RdgB/HAM1 family [Alphaproteobacteria bacterium 43-37]